jgi:hypothetical protein
MGHYYVNISSHRGLYFMRKIITLITFLLLLLSASFSLGAYENADNHKYRLSGNMLDLNISSNGEETFFYSLGYTRLVDLNNPIFLSFNFRGGVEYNLKGSYKEIDGSLTGNVEATGIFLGPSMGLGVALQGKPRKYTQKILFLSAAIGADRSYTYLTNSEDEFQQLTEYFSYYYGIRGRYEIKDLGGSGLVTV